MFNTLKNLRPLIDDTDRLLTLEEISAKYKMTLSPALLAAAYEKIVQLAYVVSRPFFGLSEEDVASFALEKLDVCLLTYREGEGKFATYFSSVFYNQLRAETEALNTHKRCIIFNSQSYDGMLENGYDVIREDESLFEIIQVLESLNLTQSEMKYCMAILQESHILRDSEIAEQLNMTRAGVGYIRKSLKKKLSLTLQSA